MEYEKEIRHRGAYCVGVRHQKQLKELFKFLIIFQSGQFELSLLINVRRCNKK